MAPAEPAQGLRSRRRSRPDVGPLVEEYLNSSCSLDALSAVSTPCASPVAMWACHVSDVIDLGEIVVHEKMQSAGVLEDLFGLDEMSVSLDETSGEHDACSFVSHTWAGFSHPDPSGIKYRTLCDILETTGDSEGPMDALKEGYVWMDFWGVPQRDSAQQSAYIDCIPRFVQRCSLFIVLAPPCEHLNTGNPVDMDAWRGRGWCRLEVASNALSLFPAPYLVADSSERLLMPSSWEPMRGSVEQGIFSCCAIKHVLSNGQKIRCDKERVAPILSNMVEETLRAARESGDAPVLARVVARRSAVLGDLPFSDEVAKQQCVLSS